MSTCPHGFDLECHLCPSYQDQLDEENYKRSLDRMFEERELEAAIVEAALQWHDPLHYDDAAPWENALDAACAALLTFREARARGDRGDGRAR